MGIDKRDECSNSSDLKRKDKALLVIIAGKMSRLYILEITQSREHSLKFKKTFHYKTHNRRYLEYFFHQ